MDDALAADVNASTKQILAPEFLLAGDARVHALQFDRADCRGFLAVGAKLTQDIELRVQDAEGRVLATSEGPTTTPFVFYCGAKGERDVVVLRVLDGQGEVVYAPLGHAQLDPRAQDEVSRCAAVGAPRPNTIDVGAEPASRPIEDELAQITKRLAGLGYRPDRAIGYGAIAPDTHNASVLQVKPGRCYALAAAGSSEVGDVDMRLFEPSVTLEPVAQDTSRKQTALLKFCAENDGRYVVDAAAFQGEGGGYGVQLYVLDEPPHVPPSVTGASRISYAEAVHRMQARGFTPEVIDSGVVFADATLSTELQVAPQSCYAVAAVGGGGAHAGKLLLALTDDHGDLLGLDAGGNGDPLVFDCVREPVARRAVVRSREVRAAGRFVLIFGRESAQLGAKSARSKEAK